MEPFRSMGLGLLLRCPFCVRGRMFRGWFAMHDDCGACGRSLRMHAGDFSGAAMIAQFAIGVIALPVFIVLAFWTSMTIEAAFLWVLGGSVVALLLFYRNIKGLWFGFLHGAETMQNTPPEGAEGERRPPA
ncbi:MAG: DUF983 domain-containing protein [Euryarchaeota archaeon]|nr:DUF983 domain-containing protein [Euryarchaeota archaeon]